MTRQLARSQPLHERLGDAFVILSVTVLSLACGAWLVANLRFALSSALLASLGLYCALLLVHLFVRRSYSGGRQAHNEDVDAHWQSASDESFEATLGGHTASRDEAASEAPLRSPPPLARTGAPHWSEPLPNAVAAPAPPLGEHGPHASDLFTFRPSRNPYFEDEASRDWNLSEQRMVPPDDRHGSIPAHELPEVNVEVIQDLIKKLADELNGATPPQTTPPEPALPFPPELRAETMLDRSVDALETTAHGMRSNAPPPRARSHADEFDNPPAPWRPERRSGGGGLVDPQLARITEALAAERIEVLLEPIQGLTEGRARHYEVSIRLRMADGAAFEQSEVARLAEGSGLMPRVDAVRMARAARVAQRLGERGRQGAVITATAGESLTDAEFLDAVALQPGTDGRIGLVLAFAQGDVRTFTPAHAEALGSMAAAGFGFALEDVTDLDMDFGRLKAMGFEFVKLDAEVFLDGLQAPSGRVPSADICRFLSEFGLTVIVGRIEDDWLLARILGFGVMFGKGALFGGLRLVKDEVVAAGTAAA